MLRHRLLRRESIRALPVGALAGPAIPQTPSGNLVGRNQSRPRPSFIPGALPYCDGVQRLLNCQICEHDGAIWYQLPVPHRLNVNKQHPGG
jgi:hypothetical protein